MSARIVVTLLATLMFSGCATTTNDFAPRAVVLDNGHYYFPAQDGNGDYYSQAPERRNTFSFEIGFGYGYFNPYFNRYCNWRPWHCPPWAYWPGHGFDYGWPYAGRPYFGHWSFDDFGGPWRGYGLLRGQRHDQGDRPRRREYDHLPNEDGALALTETGAEQNQSPVAQPPRRFRDSPGQPERRRDGFGLPFVAADETELVSAQAEGGIESPDSAAPAWPGASVAPSPADRRSRLRTLNSSENGSRRGRQPSAERDRPREPRREMPARERNSEDGHDRGEQ